MIAGAVLVLGGGAYGPIAKRAGAARARRSSAEPAGVR
ncbi:signal peptidase I [Streptomyces purpurascens]